MSFSDIFKNLVNKERLETFYQNIKSTYIKKIEKVDNGIKITKGDGSTEDVEMETTDTKNTTGSTDSSEKMFLVGATEQAEDSVTHTNTNAYIDENGQVFSGGNKTATDDEIEDILVQIDEALESMPRMVAPEDISNPNLLINPDFKINQRGLSEYDVSVNTYTVDRWCTFNFPTKITTEDGKANIRCTQQYTYSTWGQIVEELDEGTYTFSVDIVDADLTLDQIFFRVCDYNTLTEYALSILATPKATGFTSGRYTYTFNLPIKLECAWVYVYGYETEVNNSSFTISKPKLELGSIATPFVPPDPATELVKCQRYYCAVERINTVNVLNTSYANVATTFPTEMRITPTITIHSVNGTEGTVSDWASANDLVSNVAVNPANLTTNGFGEIFVSDGFTTDAVYTFGYKADAEIY